MATVKSSLGLTDKMSPVLSAITKSMNSTLTAIRSIKGAELGPEFAQAAADVRLAQNAIDDLNDSLNQAGSAAQKSGDGFTVMKGVAVHALTAIGSAIKSNITQGIDKAFARIDTMEQFNRTMTALTGSSSLATASLESVRQSVTGTAYGLDVAASAVQGFVTSGMSIGTATNQISALADATSFYGKGTNAALESVSEAWAKITTSGKVSAMEIRSLTLAGIPVYKIYADAVGRSVGDIQEDLSAGTISAAEFQRTLTDALMSGTEHFVSIEGAAKEAGASWQGTFDNMGAAIARGWTSIITEIDASLSAAGFPTLRQIIKEVGVSMEGFLNMIADNIDVIIGFGAGILSAAAAWGIYTAATWLSVAANQALIASLLANPFVWIAVVIGVIISQIYKWVQAVGGIEIAMAIAGDRTRTTLENISLWFNTMATNVNNQWSKFTLGFERASVAIQNYMGDMKVKVLTILQDMVNGAIDIINGFIGTLNNIPGVSLSVVEQVTFAATAAAENEAAKQTRAAGLAAAEASTSAAIAARNAELATMQSDIVRYQAARERQITRMQMEARAGAATAVGGELDLSDYATDTPEGKALKTKTTGKVDINTEDIQMLLDLATRDFQVTYQTLTPQIALNVDTIRETADIDQIIDTIADWTAEAAEASLYVGVPA